MIIVKWFTVLLGWLLFPLALLLMQLVTWLDHIYAQGPCIMGLHDPHECGPHRQFCHKCNKHFDIDLMSTNLDEGRIGFVEQDIMLGTVGHPSGLMWDHFLTDGNGNQLYKLLKTYDMLCAMWQGGMMQFRNRDD